MGGGGGLTTFYLLIVLVIKCMSQMRPLDIYGFAPPEGISQTINSIKPSLTLFLKHVSPMTSVTKALPSFFVCYKIC